MIDVLRGGTRAELPDADLSCLGILAWMGGPIRGMRLRPVRIRRGTRWERQLSRERWIRHPGTATPARGLESAES
jgi:hypothetical protein